MHDDAVVITCRLWRHQAIAHVPGDGFGRAGQGIAQAAAAFERFVSCYPRSSEHADIRLLLGIIYARDLRRYEEADKLLTELVSMDQQAGQSFVKGKLNDLGQRQTDLEHGLGEIQQELDRLGQEAVDAEMVRGALGQAKELFGALKPYEQRELMKLVLKRAEVNEREISLEVYALTAAASPGEGHAEGDVVRMRPVWLPE